MERHFEAELEHIREELLRMSGLVEGMIGEAIAALKERDSRLAEDVIRRDAEVDRLENQIKGACQTLIVLQQPMAGDLRFLIAVLQITNDLERMGDCAGNIGEAVLQLNREAPLTTSVDLDGLSRETRTMVRRCLDAFVARDAQLAVEIWRSDDTVDELYSDIFNELVEVMANDETAARRALQLVLIARYLERIADHASNICEDVVYYVTGKEIRHARTRYEPAS